MAESLEKYALGTKISRQGAIQRIGIIGCGVIGQELARITSQSGIEVIFIETSEERIAEVYKNLESTLDALISGWGLTAGDKKLILSRIKGSVDYNDIRNCSIVFETISTPNPLESRKALFPVIEEYVDEKTVITTSVSTLMITDVANNMIHPERAISVNFFTSPVKSNLVEVTRGIQTNDESFALLERFMKMIGKKVIGIMESPGGVSTRLIAPLINEACRILTEGISSVEDIDAIMKEGYGLSYGPFELADRIGIDKIIRYLDHLYSEFGHYNFKTATVLKRLARSHQTGKSAGRGFYLYDESGHKIGSNI